jgi:hypothetical protein
MSYKLTFNRPAETMMGEATALRIKFEDGRALFQPAYFSEGGGDLVMLLPRSRGGFKAYINGTDADKLLRAINHQHGPFSTLEWFNTKGHVNEWMVAKPWTEEGKAPPKFDPHIRIWAAEDAPHKNVEKPLATKPAKIIVPTEVEPAYASMDYLDRVRWAYNRLAEPRGPGRPVKDVIAAQRIKDQFEKASASVLPGGTLDLEAMVKAHEVIGYFLNSRHPNSADINNKAVAAAAIGAFESVERELSKIGKSKRRKTEEAHAH